MEPGYAVDASEQLACDADRVWRNRQWHENWNRRKLPTEKVDLARSHVPKNFHAISAAGRYQENEQKYSRNFEQNLKTSS